MKVEERHRTEADLYAEATEVYAKALHADYHISLDAAHEVIKAALAEAEARGAREERERIKNHVDYRRAVDSLNKATDREIDAAIRSREAKE